MYSDIDITIKTGYASSNIFSSFVKILKIGLQEIKKVPQKTKFDTRPKTKEYIHDNLTCLIVPFAIISPIRIVIDSMNPSSIE